MTVWNCINYGVIVSSSLKALRACQQSVRCMSMLKHLTSCWIYYYLSKLLLIGQHWLPKQKSVSLFCPWLLYSVFSCLPLSVSLSLSLSFSFSLWSSHSHSLHSFTWNKCMLVLVAPVAMLVSTGLSGWADLWCSTPREISSQHWCLLLSLSLPGLSQREPYSLMSLCSWSAIDYLSELICMNVLCLSFALYSNHEEMLI